MCEIVILESKGCGRYHRPPSEDSPSPPPVRTMVLEIVPVRKGEEKNAVELPTVKVPVVKAPVVNPAAIKSSAVKLPIKLPSVNLAALRTPAVQSTPSPPPSNGGGPRTAKNKNENKKRNAPATKPTHSPSPPQITSRIKVRPPPTKPRVPKIVRFAFDKTRNTAMEEINQYAESSSDDTSEESFADPPDPTYQREFNSYHQYQTLGPPETKSVRFAPSTKDNHRPSRSMAWNRFQADDKWSGSSSATLVDAGAPGTRYQKANPTSTTAQHPKVDNDLTSQARHGNDHTAPSKPMYLPDPDSDSWDSDSDLASYIDPGDCVVDRDDDGWDVPGQPPAPIFVYRSTKQASSAEPTTSKKPSSAGKKPVEPIVMHEPTPTPTKKKFLEPVFIYRNPGAPPGTEPVFVWRPSSDVNKETKCTHGECPIDWERLRTGAKKSRPRHPPATDNTRRSDKPHHRSSKPRSSRRHHHDDAEDLAAQFGRTRWGLSWRDV